MRVTIIADASHCPKSGAAGYGFWIASERGKLGGGGPMVDPVANSSAAEMKAVCNALAKAVAEALVVTGDHVLIQTDCQSAIDAFEGRRKENSLIAHERDALRAFRAIRSERSLGVSFRHVKGHTRRPEARYVTNNLCDQRAKTGMKKARAAFATRSGEHGTVRNH